MITAWIIGTPVLLLGLLLGAAALEARIVARDEREIAIRHMLAAKTASADDIERNVARLLQPLDRPRPAGQAPFARAG